MITAGSDFNLYGFQAKVQSIPFGIPLESLSLLFEPHRFKHRQADRESYRIISSPGQANENTHPCNVAEAGGVPELGIVPAGYPYVTGMERLIKERTLQERQPFEQKIVGCIVEVYLQPLPVSRTGIVVYQAEAVIQRTSRQE